MKYQSVLPSFINLPSISTKFINSPHLPKFISYSNLFNLNGYRNTYGKNTYYTGYKFHKYVSPNLLNGARDLSTSKPLNHKTKVTWDDYEDISELLFENYKNVNPLSLRFTELHEMVEDVVKNEYSLEISGECSEGALEKIQMKWLELFEDD